MINIRKNQCVGCGACADICSVGCISMLGDPEGFAYPKTDSAKCVGCGACDKVCPALNVPEFSEKIPQTFLAVNRDEAVVGSSSSGGVFSALADKVTKAGGTVCGALLTATSACIIFLRKIRKSSKSSEPANTFKATRETYIPPSAAS